MSKLSVVIPCRDEPYLKRTVKGLLDGAAGDVEVIITLDGPQEVDLIEDKRVKVIQHDKPLGRRAATNTAVRAATGKYLMKCDAHCKFAEGYDEILKADCEDNWIVVPRYYVLDVDNWKRLETKPNPVDAMRYLWPYQNQYKPKFVCRPWPERSKACQDVLIDEDMGFDGSSWFMHKSHWDRLGEMEEKGYGTFVAEPEEIGLKTWLGPWEGKVMRNKKVWYAHWSKFLTGYWEKTNNGKSWLEWEEWDEAWAYSADYWWHNRWEDRVHDTQWLIEKFAPLPGWPKDWRTKESVRLKYGNRHAARV